MTLLSGGGKVEKYPLSSPPLLRKKKKEKRKTFTQIMHLEMQIRIYLGRKYYHKQLLFNLILVNSMCGLTTGTSEP